MLLDEQLIISLGSLHRLDLTSCAELISRGASVNARDIRQQTALHYASAHNNKELSELLLNNGALVDAADQEGLTPLHWAADYGFAQVCGFLIDRGAQIDAKDFSGLTPLAWAAKNARTDATFIFLDAGANLEPLRELMLNENFNERNREFCRIMQVWMAGRIARDAVADGAVNKPSWPQAL